MLNVELKWVYIDACMHATYGPNSTNMPFDYYYYYYAQHVFSQQIKLLQLLQSPVMRRNLLQTARRTRIVQIPGPIRRG
jgi:hypothetical protein